MSQPKPPKPDPAGDYSKSLKTYLRFLPKLLAGEQQARETYDPKRIEEQMRLQDLYGARQAQQQLTALERLDPESARIRRQLAAATSGDLAAGYNLPPDFARQLTSQIRGSEAARGNVLGGAPIAAEDLYKGKAMLDLYQQHLANAGAFLAGPTPEQQLTLVQPVTPDRTSQYVNPSAPGQMAAPNYQNVLAQWQAAGGGQPSPWVQALQGIGQAAATYYGGPAGGMAAGAASRYTNTYLSDRRLKENIIPVGFSPRGFPIYEFNYKDCPGRFRGTIAQSILPLRPKAVTMDKSGYWKVDYTQLDIKLEAVEDNAFVYQPSGEVEA